MNIQGTIDNRQGIIRASGGNVSFGVNGSTIKTSLLGTLQSAGGQFIFLSPTDNTGTTLTASPTTGNLILGGATISGGRLATTGGSEFDVRIGSEIDGATIAGTIALRPVDHGAFLTLHNAVFDGGTINMYDTVPSTVPLTDIETIGNETLSGIGQINFAAGPGLIEPKNGTLTIGPGITISASGGSGIIGGSGELLANPGASFVNNQGTIVVDNQAVQAFQVSNSGTMRAQNAGSFDVDLMSNTGSIVADKASINIHGNWTNNGQITAQDGPSSQITLDGTWSNPTGFIQATGGSTMILKSIPASLGNFSVVGSTLDLETAASTAQFNGISHRSATFAIGGGNVLDNTGNTFVLTGNETLLMKGGRVNNGTLLGTASDQMLIPAGGSAWLDHVTIGMPINVNAGGMLLGDGMTLQFADVTLNSSPGSPGRFEGDVLGSGAMILNGSSPAQLSGYNAPLTVGQGVILRTGTGGGAISGPVVNNGKISAETPGQTIAISGYTLTNNGVLEAINGGTIITSSVVNNGLITTSSDPSAQSSIHFQAGGTLTGAGTLSLTGGSIVRFSSNPTPSTEQLAKLVIAGGSRVDLANNSMQIAYGTTGDPAQAVRSYLFSGYDGGKWDGPGLMTSVASAGRELGYADSADGVVSGLAAETLLVKYTAPGDASLDGSVGLNDLQLLARNFGDTGANWDQGDFNYDGTVGLDDLLLLVRNWGSGPAPTPAELSGFSSSMQSQIENAFNDVPEPAAFALLNLGGVIGLRRRRAH